MVQFEKNMYIYSVQPSIKKSKIIGSRHTNCVLRKRASYALRPSLPSSWVHSPTGPRLWTFTWSKPASGRASSDEEGGGEEGGKEGSEEESKEGSEEGGEEESEDLGEDVPLARRKGKVARV